MIFILVLFKNKWMIFIWNRIRWFIKIRVMDMMYFNGFGDIL